MIHIHECWVVLDNEIIQNTSEQNMYLLWNYNDCLKNKVYMLKGMQVKLSLKYL